MGWRSRCTRALLNAVKKFCQKVKAFSVAEVVRLLIAVSQNSEFSQMRRLHISIDRSLQNRPQQLAEVFTEDQFSVSVRNVGSDDLTQFRSQ